jgi:hypothetical protein
MSVIYALGRPFFARAHQTVVPIGTALLAGGALAGLAAMWRRPSSAASQLATLGAILLVAFAVPLAFQSAPGTTGVHLVLLAATIIIAGGIVAVAEWITAQRRVAMTAGAVAVLVAGLWSLHATALSAQADRYAPCSPTQLAADAEVQTWNIVATDVRRWLAQKAAECASGQPVPLNTRMRVIQWIREDGDVLLVNGDATTVSFTIGSSALDAGDTTANITVDGAAHVVPLKTGARTRIEYVLRPNPLSRLRAAHRVDIIMAEGDPPPLVTDLHVNRQPVAR